MALSKEYAKQLKRSGVGAPRTPTPKRKKSGGEGDTPPGNVCHACGQEIPELDLSGIDVRVAVEVTDRSERQVYRWKAGESRPDRHALRKLKEAGWL